MHIPIFYSAMLLTFVNLLLRAVGTSFQVYISSALGSAGVGLLQLVMSVGGLASVAGIAGVRTASMYLTAEELGHNRKNHISQVLSGCFLYSILFSSTVSSLLWIFSPQIAAHWIGYPETMPALRLFAAYLPSLCLLQVMAGYFTAAGRIATLSAVEVGEQFLSMVLTLAALSHWGSSDPVRACQCVIWGSSTSSCITLLCLICQRRMERSPSGVRIPMGHRLCSTALPLAAADIMKAGINTAENLMVPKRLALHAGTIDPLAAFGCVSGMVFPVLMFPACILYGLAELLIPELARCAAAKSHRRICYLVKKSLRIAMFYGLLFGGLEYLLGEWLCMKLYTDPSAGRFLKLYALLIPLLYCDAITDAMTKGLGQQKICVQINILTASMDVCFLWILLPEYGMIGYFISFALTHLINFLLSLSLLLKVTGIRISLQLPVLCFSAMGAAILGAACFPGAAGKATAYFALLASLMCLFRITGHEDVLWLRGLIRKTGA